jgi:nucleotide-binding universal stress UspA family protein
MFKTIVVGVEAWEAGSRAAALAAGLAGPGGRLVLVHVVHTPVVPAGAIGYAEQVAAKHRLEGEALLERLADANARPGLTIETRITEQGRPADVLNSIASEVGAELLVLGRSHASALSHLFGASTADRLEHLAKVPVLVAP